MTKKKKKKNKKKNSKNKTKQTEWTFPRKRLAVKNEDDSDLRGEEIEFGAPYSLFGTLGGPEVYPASVNRTTELIQTKVDRPPPSSIRIRHTRALH